MPLDWETVRRRYEADPAVQPIARSTRMLTVVAVEEERIVITSRLWTKSLERGHLETAVELIEQGTLTRRWGDFVEAYGKHVTKERRSLAAHVLTDLGYLE
ncbi:MAG: hypothetical protein R2736_08200 [Solirubrobacterales bacterium]|jgi:hypothetical protein